MLEKDREKVKEWADIERNLKTINEKREYYTKLLKDGKCIVAYECNGEYLFGPSRFVGYKDNDEMHEDKPKHGGPTNVAITKILGERKNRKEFDGLDEKFKEFVQKRGVDPANKDREYWLKCADQNKLANSLRNEMKLPQPNDNEGMVNHNKLEIRILPMSKSEEFPQWSIEEVQQKYFLKDLIEKNGYYYYRKVGMRSANGSLVLFQFDNAIIAAARILDTKKYKAPIDGLYYGAYIFDTKSVITFEPITYDELHVIDNNLAPFSQVKQIVSYDYFAEILGLIRRKQKSVFAEELSDQEVPLYIEGAKKQIVVNAYERSYKAREECIKHKGNKCLICNFDFGMFYGNEFKGKIHVHHIKALAEIDSEYQLDPLNDLIPVCPNCHLALHSKAGGEVYSVEDIKNAIQKQRKK